MSQAPRKCRYCGDEYEVGLFPAHLLIAHRPKALDPNRLRTCRVCHVRFPRSTHAEHMQTLEHRDVMLSRANFDVFAVAAAYERGDRVRDIRTAFPDINVNDIYDALVIVGIPKRGPVVHPIAEIGQRDYLARTVGDRWERIRSLREQGKSWFEIETFFTG